MADTTETAEAAAAAPSAAAPAADDGLDEVSATSAPQTGAVASKSTCPYCLWTRTPTDAVARCQHCGVRLHLECYLEAGRCTTFGCVAWSNPDEFGPVDMNPPTVAPTEPPVVGPSEPPIVGPSDAPTEPAPSSTEPPALPLVDPPSRPAFTVTFDDADAMGAPAPGAVTPPTPPTPPPSAPPQMVGFCSNCGTPRPSGRMFCTKCGTRYPS